MLALSITTGKAWSKFTAVVLNKANHALAEAGRVMAPLKCPRLHPRNTRMCYLARQKGLEMGTVELRAWSREDCPGSGSRSSLVPRVLNVEKTPQRGEPRRWQRNRDSAATGGSEDGGGGRQGGHAASSGRAGKAWKHTFPKASRKEHSLAPHAGTHVPLPGGFFLQVEPSRPQ